MARDDVALTTTKQQLREELAITGERPEELQCFYADHKGVWVKEWFTTPADEPTIIACGFNGLPEREYDPGWGGPYGEPCIAFGPKYIYFKQRYDGSEDFTHVARYPCDIERVTDIPWPGGGAGG